MPVGSTAGTLEPMPTSPTDPTKPRLLTPGVVAAHQVEPGFILLDGGLVLDVQSGYHKVQITLTNGREMFLDHGVEVIVVGRVSEAFVKVVSEAAR